MTIQNQNVNRTKLVIEAIDKWRRCFSARAHAEGHHFEHIL